MATNKEIIDIERNKLGKAIGDATKEFIKNTGLPPMKFTLEYSEDVDTKTNRVVGFQIDQIMIHLAPL